MIYFGGGRNTFEDLLNPDDMPSKEEAGLEDLEASSHIFLVDVTELVKKFSSGKGPAVAKIQYTEDTEGCGQDSTWRWKTSDGFPYLKKETGGCVLIMRDHTPLPTGESLVASARK